MPEINFAEAMLTVYDDMCTVTCENCPAKIPPESTRCRACGVRQTGEGAGQR